MTQPNILLITSDQQHWFTLGIDNPEIHTPNLDRLAKSGMVFDRAYCPNPTCTPTRASLITGQWPSQHGAYTLGTKLMEDHPTVNDTWHNLGYRTGLVGKAHFQPLESTDEFTSLEAYPLLQDLDFWRDFDGSFYGFDDLEICRNHTDEAHVGQHYAIWMEEKGFTEWREHFRKPTGTRDPQLHTWSIPEEYHYNTWIAEKTNHYLSEYKAKDQPFFLWASFFDPHPSYLAPEPWDKMYDPADLTLPQGQHGEEETGSPFFKLARTAGSKRDDFGISKPQKTIHGLMNHNPDPVKLSKNMAIYYGMISCMDKYIGKILDHLDTLGLTENTLIAFTSDHGHFYGHHGLVAKGPFHFEDGVKVPLIVSWPGNVPAGTRSDAIQSLVDLPTTFITATGADIPHHMTGLNQLPSWAEPDTHVRHHTLVENNHEPGIAEMKTYINRRYKITLYVGFDHGDLFDLEKDPGEFKNLWYDPNHAELKARLLQEFLQAEMLKEVRPMPRITHA